MSISGKGAQPIAFAMASSVLKRVLSRNGDLNKNPKDLQ
jgi:hypothetical protein